jgi:paraquat-inducible protein A
MPKRENNTRTTGVPFYRLHGIWALSSWIIAFSFAYLLFPATLVRNDCGLITYGAANTLHSGRFLLLFALTYFPVIPLSFWLFKGKDHLLRLPYLFFLILLLSIALYTLGIFFPILKTTRLLLCDSYARLPDSIQYFIQKDEVFLAAVIATFSIGFPVIKYLFMFAAFGKGRDSMAGRALSQIGKFSMLDVFIVGLVIFIFKQQSFLLNVTSESGIVFFTVSILLSIGVSIFLSLDRKSGSG